MEKASEQLEATLDKIFDDNNEDSPNLKEINQLLLYINKYRAGIPMQTSVTEELFNSEGFSFKEFLIEKIKEDIRMSSNNLTGL